MDPQLLDVPYVATIPKSEVHRLAQEVMDDGHEELAETIAIEYLASEQRAPWCDRFSLMTRDPESAYVLDRLLKKEQD